MSQSNAAVPGVGLSHFRCNRCWERFSDQDDDEFSTFKIRGCNHNICEKCYEDYQADKNAKSGGADGAGHIGGIVSSTDVDCCLVCNRKLNARRDVVEIKQRDLLTCHRPNPDLVKEIYLNPHSKFKRWNTILSRLSRLLSIFLSFFLDILCNIFS